MRYSFALSEETDSIRNYAERAGHESGTRHHAYIVVALIAADRHFLVWHGLTRQDLNGDRNGTARLNHGHRCHAPESEEQ